MSETPEKEGLAVTVAVAACGRPDGLKRCLAGLAAGTRVPDAVLVIDQGDDPACRLVAEGAGLDGLRYVAQPRLGLSASRNLALQLTETPLLAVTDDDCVPEPGWVEGLIGAFAGDPAPAAVTGPVLPLGPARPGTYAISLRPDLVAREYRGRTVPWNVGSGGNFAARCEVLRAHGAWDRRLGAGSAGLAGEDAELLYRLLRAGRLVRYEPAAALRHDRQDRSRRLATRYSYAFGIGALCGLWVRRGDRYAVRLALSYALDHTGKAVAGLRTRDSDARQQHLRALRGLGAGLRYGLTAPGSPAPGSA